MMEEEDKGKNEHTQPLTARGFYGKAQSQDQVLLRIAKTRKHLKQRPIVSEYRPGILGPPATWKTFRCQADAIKFAQVQGNGLMVFSFEGEALGQGGKRNFVVTHPKMMWIHQCERSPNQRCTYEVIQENSVCKLYFDLEFMYMRNPESDGVQMTNTFIKIVCYFLLKEFGVCCSRKNIIDLTSYSFAKFSRHLIFNIPGVAFANNIHVGNFVIMICNQIRAWAREGMKEMPGFTFTDVETLFVTDTKGNKVLFCDEGVYTKNRNFRILRSTKLGKNTPLEVAQENQYVPLTKMGGSAEEMLFLDSLVTTVRESPKILTFGDDGMTRPKCRQKEREGAGPRMEGFSHSPYPEIDKYIQSILGHGYIRCWFYFPQSELLVYEIANNRFCHNIGREHKSNGVMYVANLKLAVYYQKCHDSDCQDYRSNPIPLPEWTVFWKKMGEEEVLEWIQDSQNGANDIWDDDDDSLLTMAATQIENEHNNNVMDVAATEFENEDDNNLLLMAAEQVENEYLSDSKLTSAVKKFEMWDKVDEMSLSSLSRQSSQKSNPWDRLSLISSPNSSFFDESSQKSQDDCRTNLCPETFIAEQKVWQNSNTYDFESDEEFASAAAKVEDELQKQAGDEVEFNSCGLDDEDFVLP